MVGINQDFDLKVHYHPGKTNVLADALSHKVHCNSLSVESYNETLCSKMRKLSLEIIPHGTLNHISIDQPFMTESSWDNYMIKVLRSSNKNSLKEKGSISVFVRIIRESYGLKVA